MPPVLAVCETLEELNVASNPLRVLPVFLAGLLNLRVLIADSTGINTLPDALLDLDKIHTISIRRNKLHALPSWLCLLPALQTLCVDGNPFQGPWKALVDPLLAKVPSTPAYPPSTPMMPLSATSTADTDGTDVDEFSDHEASPFVPSPEEEDHTITPERGPFLSRSTTSPLPLNSNPPPLPQNKPLTRTRTTPNRAYFEQTRTKSGPSTMPDPRVPRQGAAGRADEPGEREIRKMKSAGDLRRGKSANAIPAESEMPTRPAINKYPTSLSSSNLLNMSAGATPEHYNKRFASLGPSSQFGSTSRATPNALRPQLSQSMWENNSQGSDLVNDNPTRSSYAPSTNPPIQMPVKLEDGDGSSRARSTREKPSRWGFLKKMSMGKMKPDTPPMPSNFPNPPRIARPQTSAGTPISRAGANRISKTPQIDLRLSTTGMLDAFPLTNTPSPNPPPQPLNEAALLVPSIPLPPPSPNGLLSPPTTHPRAKRRSFLPVDAPGTMSLSIPENSTFVTGVVVSHDGEETAVPVSGQEARALTPSPILDHEQYIRREEDRARDAYMRALRSVMAYLKDMNDLGTVQQGNPLSMYSSSGHDDHHITVRSRRPTVVEAQREPSMASSSTLASLSDSSGHLRSSDSIAGLRSGSSSQTLSVATTDSNGSSEERKYKDDKGKRAMVIREIVL